MGATHGHLLGVMFDHRPIGSRLWLRAVGSSMFPLFFSGEELLVERVDESAVRRGEVAVLRDPPGQVVVHLVVGTRPLATSSYLGVRDQQPMRVLGRVVAMRRFGREVRLRRWATMLGHRLAASARPAMGIAVRSALRWTRPVRGAVAGGLAARPVRPDEMDRAVEFAAGIAGALVHSEVLNAVRRRDAVVALARGGRWLAIGWRDEGGILHAASSRLAEGLNAEDALRQALR